MDPLLFKNEHLETFFEDDLSVDRVTRDFVAQISQAVGPDVVRANAEHLRKTSVEEFKGHEEPSSDSLDKSKRSGDEILLSSMERAVRMTIMGGSRNEQRPPSEDVFDLELPTIHRRETM